jgi:hypothetical protein
VAAGDDGNLRVRHEASPGTGLLRGEHGAARTGDQESWHASQVRSAQAAGDAPADLDPDVEAIGLLALASGLGTSILAGQSSPGQAEAVIDYHLDRLFPRPVQRYA